jgi:hypothetical protein
MQEDCQDGIKKSRYKGGKEAEFIKKTLSLLKSEEDSIRERLDRILPKN